MSKKVSCRLKRVTVHMPNEYLESKLRKGRVKNMNPIIQILKEQNISEEKIVEVFQALTENPMMAMAIVQQLGIPPEKLQAIMGLVMTNPDLIKEAVEELGLDFARVEAAKAELKKQQG